MCTQRCVPAAHGSIAYDREKLDTTPVPNHGGGYLKRNISTLQNTTKQ